MAQAIADIRDRAQEVGAPDVCRHTTFRPKSHCSERCCCRATPLPLPWSYVKPEIFTGPHMATSLMRFARLRARRTRRPGHGRRRAEASRSVRSGWGTGNLIALQANTPAIANAAATHG